MSAHPQTPRRLLLAAGVSLFLVACPSGPEQPKEPAAPPDAGKPVSDNEADIAKVSASNEPVARVNGKDVPRKAFLDEYKLTIGRYEKARHTVQPALRERLKDNIVRRLVDSEMIRQQAEKLDVVLSPEELEKAWEEHKKRYGTEEAFKSFLERAGTTAEDVKEQFRQNMLREKLFDRVSQTIEVTEAELKEFYEKNKDRYNEPEQVKASHILIKLPPKAPPEEKAKKMALAKEILGQAKAKGADFAALATKYSEDTSGPRGGDLGLFTRGRMVKPFEEAAWKLKVGEVSGIVETDFGFHIIKKTGHEKAKMRTFAEMKEQIERSVRARKRNEAIRDAMQKWKDEAKVEILLQGDPAIINAGMPGMTGGATGAINLRDRIGPGGHGLGLKGQISGQPQIPIQRIMPPSATDRPVVPATPGSPSTAAPH